MRKYGSSTNFGVVHLPDDFEKCDSMWPLTAAGQMDEATV